MIDLTRLNGSRVQVNCDLIQYAEAAPDTILTLVTGERLMVREPLTVLADLITSFRGAVLREAIAAKDPAGVLNLASAAAASAATSVHSLKAHMPGRS
jgi:flagellar protein FlbD